MSAVHEKLRLFYWESFAKSLKVRKTSTNRILTMVQGDESVAIAKFNADTDPELADRLLDHCRSLVIELMVDREMVKLTEGGSESPGIPIEDLNKSIIPELDI